MVIGRSNAELHLTFRSGTDILEQHSLICSRYYTSRSMRRLAEALNVVCSRAVTVETPCDIDVHITDRVGIGPCEFDDFYAQLWKREAIWATLPSSERRRLQGLE